jgi:hypothetical protein
MKKPWQPVSIKPTRKTRNASKYGVPVLLFDERDYRISGTCTPSEGHFMFDNVKGLTGFIQYGLSYKKGRLVGYDPMPACPTHWRPLPTGPFRAICPEPERE